MKINLTNLINTINGVLLIVILCCNLYLILYHFSRTSATIVNPTKNEFITFAQNAPRVTISGTLMLADDSSKGGIDYIRVADGYLVAIPRHQFTEAQDKTTVYISGFPRVRIPSTINYLSQNNSMPGIPELWIDPWP